MANIGIWIRRQGYLEAASGRGRGIQAGLQIRLLAFWDKTDSKETLVIATHGFIKKVDKIPGNELNRAVRLRVFPRLFVSILS
ncbi:MAG: type II toxin-antitoxin system RelE/ParE family toxin [Balneolales bacterium]|nr:type II toxin-antitoxin system RelE/ParE family toxin [Balneolales bacterium]